MRIDFSFTAFKIKIENHQIKVNWNYAFISTFWLNWWNILYGLFKIIQPISIFSWIFDIIADTLSRLFCLYMCYFLVCHLVYPLVNWMLISWFIILGNDEFQEALKHQNSQSANDSYDDDQETWNHTFKTKRFACVIRTELGKWFVVIIESTLPTIFLHSDGIVVEKFQKRRVLLKSER